jgi:DNA-binding NarL/FixJ family response regulator
VKPVRILIADDHEVVRKGLRAILEAQPGWMVSRESSTGREAVEAALSEKPDIIIMDVNMPELNGLDATRQIVKANPAAQVIVLSAHDSENLIRQMLSSGARGYVLKSDAGQDLVAAVEALLQRRIFFTSTVSEVVLGDYVDGGAGTVRLPDSPAGRLSAREREIVQLLAEGRTNKEIAGRLNLSVKTVETHRRNVMSKLDCHSLSDLVRFAIQNEIIRA